MEFPKEFVLLPTISPSLIIDLRYRTNDNITGQPLYQSNDAWARRELAELIHYVQGDLQKAGLGLKVWDAYRPVAVQKALWNACPDEKFIAHPDKGSFHNRGLAIDVTLVDASGNELELPTKFDDFSPKAAMNFTELPDHVLKNRRILQETMFAYGLEPLASEWWHFMLPNLKDQAPILDIPL